jgi:hypothetical protein
MNRVPDHDLKDPPFVSTYRVPWHEGWNGMVTAVPKGNPLRSLWRILRAARRSEAVILRGSVDFRSGYVDLIATALLSRRRGRPVVLGDSSWQLGSRSFDRLLGARRPEGYDAQGQFGRRLSRAVIRTMDGPSVHYCVLSSSELETFPATWGLPADRVHFTPFCATTQEPPHVPGGEGIFAGGDSLRDYRALLAAAPSLAAPLTIATRLPMPSTGAASVGPLSRERYDEAFRGAAVIVVPLQPDMTRSAGQQTYLNAMAMGKPVIVTDAPGVRDYIDDGRTGIIVAPDDPAALAAAVNGLLADTARARRIGAAARAVVLDRYLDRHYFDRVLALTVEQHGRPTAYPNAAAQANG